MKILLQFGEQDKKVGEKGKAEPAVSFNFLNFHR